MKYEYKCPVHGAFRCDTRLDVIRCRYLDCTEQAQRVWGFTFKPMFQSHYNPSVGVEVNSQSQLQSELSRASDSMNQRGIPSSFKPVDWRDKEALGVTNDGLDSTYNALRAQGNDGAARRLKALMDE